METIEAEYNVLLDEKHSMRKKTMNRKIFLFTGDVKEEHGYHYKSTSSVFLWIYFTVEAPYGLGVFCKLLFHKPASLLRSHVGYRKPTSLLEKQIVLVASNHCSWKANQTSEFEYLDCN